MQEPIKKTLCMNLTKLNPATMNRYLNALEKHHFVHEDGTHRFQLTESGVKLYYVLSRVTMALSDAVSIEDRKAALLGLDIENVALDNQRNEHKKDKIELIYESLNLCKTDAIITHIMTKSRSTYATCKSRLDALVKSGFVKKQIADGPLRSSLRNGRPPTLKSSLIRGRPPSAIYHNTELGERLRASLSYVYNILGEIGIVEMDGLTPMQNHGVQVLRRNH